MNDQSKHQHFSHRLNQCLVILSALMLVVAIVLSIQTDNELSPAAEEDNPSLNGDANPFILEVQNRPPPRRGTGPGNARPGGAGQRPSGQRRMRQHTANKRGKLSLVNATQRPPVQGQVSIKVEGRIRIISANSIPTHPTGPFPNRGNPNPIAPQKLYYRIEAFPKATLKPTAMSRHPFGIAVNGVAFDPGAAEFYRGNPALGWQYEALSGAVPLGVDINHAHVQPTGAYHYHGLPTLLLKQLKISKHKHSPLIGWAADGYPIYALYGYTNPKDPKSKVKQLKSSYQIRKGYRNPLGNHGQSTTNPGGKFDGAFIQDYEFIPGSGDLDECNGRYTITPEFPQGTYAYYLTENWPVIPRLFRAAPAWDFLKRR